MELSESWQESSFESLWVGVYPHHGSGSSLVPALRLDRRTRLEGPKEKNTEKKKTCHFWRLLVPTRSLDPGKYLLALKEGEVWPWISLLSSCHFSVLPDPLSHLVHDAALEVPLLARVPSASSPPASPRAPLPSSTLVAELSGPAPGMGSPAVSLSEIPCISSRRSTPAKQQPTSGSARRVIPSLDAEKAAALERLANNTAVGVAAGRVGRISPRASVVAPARAGPRSSSPRAELDSTAASATTAGESVSLVDGTGHTSRPRTRTSPRSSMVEPTSLSPRTSDVQRPRGSTSPRISLAEPLETSQMGSVAETTAGSAGGSSSLQRSRASTSPRNSNATVAPGRASSPRSSAATDTSTGSPRLTSSQADLQRSRTSSSPSVPQSLSPRSSLPDVQRARTQTSPRNSVRDGTSSSSPRSMLHRRVICVSLHEATNELELTLRPGDVGEVIDVDVAEGWFSVRRGEQTGLVRSDCVLSYMSPRSSPRTSMSTK